MMPAMQEQGASKAARQQIKQQLHTSGWSHARDLQADTYKAVLPKTQPNSQSTDMVALQVLLLLLGNVRV